MAGLLALLIVALYIWVGYETVKRLKTRKIKFIAAAIYILIPTWDVISGRFYFYILCATEGGQMIYKTVEIGKEYYGPDVKNAKLPDGIQWEVGKVYTIHVEGDHPAVKRTVRFIPDLEKLKDRYDILVAKFADEKILNVQKIFSLVKDKQTGEILGTATSFAYWGGWVANHSGLHVTAVECPETKMNPYEPSDHSTLLNKVFKPARN